MAKNSELRIRFIFGPLMLAMVAGVFLLDKNYTNGICSAVLLGLLAMGGMLEYINMMRKAEFQVASGLLLGMTLLLVSSAFLFGWKSTDHELYPLVLGTMFLLFPLALRGLAPKGMSHGLEEMGSTLLGFLLVAWPLYLAQGLSLRHLNSLLFVVLVCKGGDIGGYLFGVALGRHKLIPHISPGKTIEGALGSLVTSCALAFFLSGPLLLPEVQAEWWVFLAIGIMLNLTTQIGDLVESLLKRRCGVKDSSTLLPAHGGVLDLMDSLLFSFPAYFLVLNILT